MVDRTVRAGTAHEADDDPVRIVDALLGLGRPVPTTDPADWLLRDSFAIEDMLSFFDEFCWRLVGWSLPLSRVTLHVTALHPQLSGFGCRWTRRTGRIERLAIALGGYDTRTFDQSPIKSSVVDGESLRCRLFRATETGFPVLDRLKRDGATDYLALPLLRWQTGFPTVTFATDQAEGFSDLQIGRLERLTAPLGAVIQTRIARRVTIDLLATYLGERAGA